MVLYPLLLWIAIAIFLFPLLLREWGAYARVEADDLVKKQKARQRFHRRLLGGVLLVLLLLLLQFGDALTHHSTLQQKMLYYLGCFLLLFWVLILAARDFRDLAMDFATAQTRMTLSTLSEVQREVARKNTGTDNSPIPPLNFEVPNSQKQSQEGKD
ncbi:MAG: hypothetical protein SFY68_06570 [Candidatus Sumerlaeia bacterium]|nr:hypothetical protein [Candidatus Sumerlaeia bacterium]